MALFWLVSFDPKDVQNAWVLVALDETLRNLHWVYGAFLVGPEVAMGSVGCRRVPGFLVRPHARGEGRLDGCGDGGQSRLNSR